MSKAKHSETIPPLLGRILHLQLQPAARLTWVGAGWAALCGVVAAGTLQWSADAAVRVLLTLILADAVLGTAWSTLFNIRNPSPLEPSADGEHDPGTSVPANRVSLEPRVIKVIRPGDKQISEDRPATDELNLEPVSTSFWASMGAGFDGRLRPGFDFLRALGSDSVRVWWSRLVGTRFQRGLEVGLVFGLALLLGLALGRGVAAVVGLGLLFPWVIWFALGEHPLQGGWARALLEIGLPWTIGLAAFTSFDGVNLGGLSGLALAVVFWTGDHVEALAVGMLFVVAFYAKLTLNEPLPVLGRRALLNLPQVAAVVLMVIWRQPVLAGAAAMLVLAQMLFQPYLDQRHVRWYLRSTQWMFMGVMLIAALGVAASYHQ